MSELLAIASELRALAGRLERATGHVVDGETLTDWATRWFEQRRSAGREREWRIYQEHVAPMIGTRTVASLTRDDVSGWVESMDDLVAQDAIRWRTAHRRWVFLRAMLRDLCRSKRRDLRVRVDDITMGVRGPDHGNDRAGTFLYPAEFLQLCRCSAVPRERRRVYALAIYIAPRSGELAALRWEDVDLRSGRIHIFQSVDAETGLLVSTKTGCDRRFIVEPTALELLKAMRGRAPSAARLVQWSRDNAATTLRRDLLLAGCDREELHVSDARRRPLSFHDLRATGITWWAMRGDPIGDIMERVGHAQIMTTQRYMRRGRLLVSSGTETLFPAIPRAVF